MKYICVYCGSSNGIPVEYLSAAHQMGALANGALENGGQVVGLTLESLNTPTLAHNGLTHEPR